jgi:hypothetical protein
LYRPPDCLAAPGGRGVSKRYYQALLLYDSAAYRNLLGFSSLPFYVLSFARPFSFGDLVTWRFVDLEHGDLSVSMICPKKSHSCSLRLLKSPNQKIKKSPNGRGGSGKAASRPARAHAQKDYASRKNHRWAWPSPSRPATRRAARPPSRSISLRDRCIPARPAFIGGASCTYTLYWLINTEVINPVGHLLKVEARLRVTSDRVFSLPFSPSPHFRSLVNPHPVHDHLHGQVGRVHLTHPGAAELLVDEQVKGMVVGHCEGSTPSNRG